jgi:hypothetical protein
MTITEDIGGRKYNADFEHKENKKIKHSSEDYTSSRLTVHSVFDALRVRMGGSTNSSVGPSPSKQGQQSIVFDSAAAEKEIKPLNQVTLLPSGSLRPRVC